MSNKRHNFSFGKILAIILTIVIVCTAAITAVGIGSSGFTNTHIKTWFNNWGKGTQEKQEENDPETEETASIGGMVIGDSAGSVRILSEVMAASDDGDKTVESTVQLTLVVEPEDATDNFVWSVTDEDHIGLQAGDKGRTCVVNCYGGFPEQITITATSDLNSDLYATCTVDYVKRVTSLTVTMSPDKITYNTTEVAHTLTITPNFGVGTLTPEVSYSSVIKNNLSGLTTSLSNYSDTQKKFYNTNAKTCDFTFDGNSFSALTPYDMFVNGVSKESYEAGMVTSYNPSTNNHIMLQEQLGLVKTYTVTTLKADVTYPTASQLKSAYNNSVINKATGTTSDGTITISYTSIYSGTTYSQGTSTLGVGFNVDNLKVSATSVSSNSESVVF